MLSPRGIGPSESLSDSTTLKVSTTAFPGHIASGRISTPSSSDSSIHSSLIVPQPKNLTSNTSRPSAMTASTPILPSKLTHTLSHTHSSSSDDLGRLGVSRIPSFPFNGSPSNFSANYRSNPPHVPMSSFSSAHNSTSLNGHGYLQRITSPSNASSGYSGSVTPKSSPPSYASMHNGYSPSQFSLNSASRGPGGADFNRNVNNNNNNIASFSLTKHGSPYEHKGRIPVASPTTTTTSSSSHQTQHHHRRPSSQLRSMMNQLQSTPSSTGSSSSSIANGYLPRSSTASATRTQLGRTNGSSSSSSGHGPSSSMSIFQHMPSDAISPVPLLSTSTSTSIRRSSTDNKSHHHHQNGSVPSSSSSQQQQRSNTTSNNDESFLLPGHSMYMTTTQTPTGPYTRITRFPSASHDDSMLQGQGGGGATAGNSVDALAPLAVGIPRYLSNASDDSSPATTAPNPTTIYNFSGYGSLQPSPTNTDHVIHPALAASSIKDGILSPRAFPATEDVKERYRKEAAMMLQVTKEAERLQDIPKMVFVPKTYASRKKLKTNKGKAVSKKTTTTKSTMISAAAGKETMKTDKKKTTTKKDSVSSSLSSSSLPVTTATAPTTATDAAVAEKKVIVKPAVKKKRIIKHANTQASAVRQLKAPNKKKNAKKPTMQIKAYTGEVTRLVCVLPPSQGTSAKVQSAPTQDDDDGNVLPVYKQTFKSWKCVYIGEISHKVPHGHGLVVYQHMNNKNGGGKVSKKNIQHRVYEGEWKFGLADGAGKLILGDGRVIDGIFQQGSLFNENATMSTQEEEENIYIPSLRVFNEAVSVTPAKYVPSELHRMYTLLQVNVDDMNRLSVDPDAMVGPEPCYRLVRQSEAIGKLDNVLKIPINRKALLKSYRSMDMKKRTIQLPAMEVCEAVVSQGVTQPYRLSSIFQFTKANGKNTHKYSVIFQPHPKIEYEVAKDNMFYVYGRAFGRLSAAERKKQNNATTTTTTNGEAVLVGQKRKIPDTTM